MKNRKNNVSLLSPPQRLLLERKLINGLDIPLISVLIELAVYDKRKLEKSLLRVINNNNILRAKLIFDNQENSYFQEFINASTTLPIAVDVVKNNCDNDLDTGFQKIIDNQKIKISEFSCPWCITLLNTNKRTLLIISLSSLFADDTTAINMLYQIADVYDGGLLSHSESQAFIPYEAIAAWLNEIMIDSGLTANNSINSSNIIDQSSDGYLSSPYPGKCSDETFLLACWDCNVIVEMEEKYHEKIEYIIFSCYALALDGANTDSNHLEICLNGRDEKELMLALGPISRTSKVNYSIDSDTGIAGFIRYLRVRYQIAKNEFNLWFEQDQSGTNSTSDFNGALDKILFEYKDHSLLGNKLKGNLFSNLYLLENSHRAYSIKLECTKISDSLKIVLKINPDYIDALHAKHIKQSLEETLLFFQNEKKSSIRDVLKKKNDKCQQYLAGLVNIQTIPHSNIYELFKRQSRINAQMTAIYTDSKKITFSDLDTKVRVVAHMLTQMLRHSGKIVAISCGRTIEHVIAMLGVMKSGNAFLPLAEEPNHRLKTSLKKIGATTLITTSQNDTNADLFGHIMVIDRKFFDSYKIEDNIGAPAVLPESSAYVMFTSGTTAKPKPVIITHQSLVNLLGSLRRLIYNGINGEPVTVGVNNTNVFDSSIKQFLQLCDGHKLVIIPDKLRMDGKELGNYIRAYNIQVIDFTPTHLKILLETDFFNHNLPLTHVLVGGEFIDADLWNILAAHESINFYNLYGVTECAVDTTLTKISGHRTHIGSVIDNTQVYLIDDNLEHVAYKQKGRISIAGISLSQGYLAEPAITAECFIPDPFSGIPGARMYMTSDNGILEFNDLLSFKERTEQEIKIRGHKVSIAEIESSLRDIANIEDVKVLIQKSERGIDELVGFVKPIPISASSINGINRMNISTDLSIAYYNKDETEFLYRDLFINNAYFRHGISLPEKALVLDVGGNIGMFSLLVYLIAPDAELEVFEPNPEIYEILKLNMDSYGIPANVHNCGLGNTESLGQLEFLSGLSILSGLHVNKDDEKEVLRSWYRQQMSMDTTPQSPNEGKRGADDNRAYLEDYEERFSSIIDKSLQSCSISVKIQKLSAFIDNKNINCIDLLKINAEKAELDIIEELGDKHWKIIQQLVVEVHNIDNRLNTVKNILKEKGYHVLIDRDWSLSEHTQSNFYIYASRKPLNRAVNNLNDILSKNIKKSAILTEAELYETLRQQLPEYLIPSGFMFIEQLPMSNHCKVDKKKLFNLYKEHCLTKNKYVELPEGKIEEGIYSIWKNILGRQNFGINDSFFNVGGNSVLLVQVAVQIEKLFDVDVPVSVLFDYPSIKLLARYIQKEGSTIEPRAESADSDSQRRANRQRLLKKRRQSPSSLLTGNDQLS